ncbi:MAG: glycosyltransferase family 2 protein, partial [Pyrinomonadaceae bacterium]
EAGRHAPRATHLHPVGEAHRAGGEIPVMAGNLPATFSAPFSATARGAARADERRDPSAGSMDVSAPPLSVVMPARNARPFLDESVRSILGQTFRDFEFVILDDASTDGTGEALREWAREDARIRLYRSAEPLGHLASSNLVVRKSRAPLVARMDADDISHPERLRRQVEVLAARPDVALVGTLADGIDAAGRRVRPRDRWRLLRRSTFAPFPHGSIMFRREAFERTAGYCREDGFEDQRLYSGLACWGRVLVVPEALYSYRYHAGNLTIAVTESQSSRPDRRRVNEPPGGEVAARDVDEERGGETSSDRGGQAGVRKAQYSLGTMRLWAGEHAGVLRLMLSHGIRGGGWRALPAFAWGAWGDAHPASLRLLMRSFIRARDAGAGLRVKDGKLYEWRSG